MTIDFFCQGESRGFESRSSAPTEPPAEQGVSVFHVMRSLSVLPITARDLPITNGQVRPWLVDVAGVSGTVRQRGVNSWELRVFAGTDPLTGRRR